MDESPDTRYGRVLASFDIGGYATEGGFRDLEDLIVSGDWPQVGPGFQDFDAFLATIDLSRYKLPASIRVPLEKAMSEAGGSQRAISGATGVSQPTVSRDLNSDSNESEDQDENTSDLPEVTDEVDASDSNESEDQDMPAGQDEADEILSHFDDETAAAKPAPVMLTLLTHTGEPVEYPKPASKATFNQTDGEGISWAAWSWNPVTGCLHGCDYCYARAIAHRFTDGFPAGFTPLFHHERLDAPANTTIPAAHRNDPAWRRVFVCSMADLYGRWVPDEWIKQVHESMLATPEWEYLLLTKFPARYVGLEMPTGTWLGTSVDEQKRVRIAEDAFRQVDGVKVKWLSLEPLREPLEFSDLSMFDWVVIGAQTETRQPDGTVDSFTPPWEWVCRITAQAKEAGCKVHWKPNLFNGKPGLPLNEYPGE